MRGRLNALKIGAILNSYSVARMKNLLTMQSRGIFSFFIFFDLSKTSFSVNISSVASLDHSTSDPLNQLIAQITQLLFKINAYQCIANKGKKCVNQDSVTVWEVSGVDMLAKT
ncbi:uncharacterized protein LOC127095923 [Lathyrus oleraceus]|uniref:uncharacterized protein LOC127095923 n=1 Tax=Pisum sativum TaxID=3888 RepID=UPI001FC3CEE1|nr:uncharacterized protein LOC127095923 [Pisum sativum]